MLNGTTGTRDSDPGIDDPATLARRQSHDGIQVEFDGLRHLLDQPRHAQENVFEGGNVCRWMTPIALKEIP